MELNEVKFFEALRYGNNEKLKQETNYTTPTGKIVVTTKKHVKDLGVIMSSDCTFKQHINKTIEKAKNITSPWNIAPF